MKMLPCLTLVSVLLSGCTSFYDRHVEYTDVKPESFPLLRAVGYAPISAQLSNDPKHKMLQAMKASKLDAYKEMTEMVYGQKIDATTQVQHMVLTDEKLSTSIRGVISGARVVKTYAVDDVYITELELDFAQVYSLYQNTTPRQTIKSVRYY
ncbi:LPP20 family lipoprotein [Rheinheimera baltica]|uniref:LPP20 family lipoprotein n=1 Tax=Rheinheimera baltica TaxID=67576 RepID=A0ABT9HUM1_9GAMM|nr:LPP20 family lipoprotein [Rheinheimera baltica]MDP5134830.1 LPP20 family lipoprotein [Rheinheimera baltica]MDP5149919.1 LPP20 family lipoprotein [Rheinheimera baltica]MDP5190686.1 LPP20 family lipoprotein [Rheinheimera baltica]